MLPLIFGAVSKFGSKIAKGIKASKGIKNGLQAAKNIQAQSMYIGTNIPVSSLASVPIADEPTSVIGMQKDINHKLTTDEKIKKFAPIVVIVAAVIIVIKLIFKK